MSVKSSLAFLCIDEESPAGIHVFRVAGTEEYYISTSGYMPIPRGLALNLEKVLEKHSNTQEMKDFKKNLKRETRYFDRDGPHDY